MRVEPFDFDLPAERIAQRPAEPRDSARLLEVGADAPVDRVMRDLPTLLRKGDLLVFNDTRVIPARLHGIRLGDGGDGPEARRDVSFEALLVRRLANGAWRAFCRPGKRLKQGDTLRFGDDLAATVRGKTGEGALDLVFDADAANLPRLLDAHGAVPLPPYIRGGIGDERDRVDYQTVYAARDGAVAAPTAGLHFTPGLLAALRDMGVATTMVTLHVGAGTFQPVRVADTEAHVMHAEWGEVGAEAVDAIETARARGGRVVSVGTTPLRLLESVAAERGGRVEPWSGETSIFITPGFRFCVVDLLLTNFHLPRSTLFMLVSAFAGLERMRAAYVHAVAREYRFYSYGDATLLHRNEFGMSVGYEVMARDGAARRGRLSTAHGTVETPAFMPVGTAATVKAMLPESVAATGAEIVLGNTYHLMLRPGAERVERLGGLHRFMNWKGPILTDSGGFQVMSLSKLRNLDAEGVTFRSHIDGSAHRLTPDISLDIQRQLGADITMSFDECTSWPVTEEEAAKSMRLSMCWAERGRRVFVERAGHGLFGIVQGSVFPELRLESAKALTDIGFDGYAIGGLAVGEGQAAMFATLDVTVPALPADRPRYLMGVGRPADIVGAVARGIDMFDCVMPTRAGRTAQAFTWRGELNLRNARHRDDHRPLAEGCACPACTGHSRAYLHHLIRSEEILGAMLLTWHNLHFYQDVMRGLRAAIEAGTLAGWSARFVEQQGLGDIEALS